LPKKVGTETGVIVIDRCNVATVYLILKHINESESRDMVGGGGTAR
jgi:maleate cis-trans isomerase